MHTGRLPSKSNKIQTKLLVQVISKDLNLTIIQNLILKISTKIILIIRQRGPVFLQRGAATSRMVTLFRTLTAKIIIRPNSTRGSCLRLGCRWWAAQLRASRSLRVSKSVFNSQRKKLIKRTYTQTLNLTAERALTTLRWSNSSSTTFHKSTSKLVEAKVSSVTPSPITWETSFHLVVTQTPTKQEEMLTRYRWTKLTTN